MLKKFALAMLVAVFALSLALPVAAQIDNDDPFGQKAIGNSLILGSKDIRETVGSIINVALGFLGVVAVVIILIGGFKYMTAGGAQEKIDNARKYIISGIIGLAIILSAYAITTFVISRLLEATTST